VDFAIKILTNPSGDYLGQFAARVTAHYTVLIGFLSDGRLLPCFIVSD